MTAALMDAPGWVRVILVAGDGLLRFHRIQQHDQQRRDRPQE